MKQVRIGAVELLTIDAIYSGLPRMPKPGEELACRDFFMTLGGSPVAALVTAGRLGADTRLYTQLGTDDASVLAEGYLKREGVTYRSANCAFRGRSPINYTSVMTFADSDRAFASYFADTDFFEAELDEKLDYLAGCDYCVIASPEPELPRSLSEAGIRVAFDISCRSGTELRSLLPALKHAHVLTPNEKEACELAQTSDPVQALRELSRYVERVVVKLGAEGACYLEGDRVVRVPVEPVEVVDTTGAGDAFMGGLVFGLAQGWAMERCVRLANYTGSVATTALGCLTAKPSLEEWLAKEKTNA